MSDAEEVKFPLKVVINKEKTKVLFVESDGHFVDVLLSFLTLPLGRIVKVLGKNYAPPTIGCLSSLYNSVVNLDSSHFWTDGAKQILLNPTNSFDTDCRGLKIDISDSSSEWFSCENCSCRTTYGGGKSIYYDKRSCIACGDETIKRVVCSKLPLADCSHGVFTLYTSTFVITDDLRIVPNATGLVQTVSILDIKGTEGAKILNVTFGLTEVSLDLLFNN